MARLGKNVTWSAVGQELGIFRGTSRHYALHSAWEQWVGPAPDGPKAVAAHFGVDVTAPSDDDGGSSDSEKKRRKKRKRSGGGGGGANLEAQLLSSEESSFDDDDDAAAGGGAGADGAAADGAEAKQQRPTSGRRASARASAERIPPRFIDAVKRARNADRDSWFLEPVAEALSDQPEVLAQYRAMIEEPMCFSDVLSKYQSGGYARRKELRRDVRLVRKLSRFQGEFEDATECCLGYCAPSCVSPPHTPLSPRLSR